MTLRNPSVKAGVPAPVQKPARRIQELEIQHQKMRRAHRELEVAHAKLLRELAKHQRALAKAKCLSGLINICAGCKRIRDGHGWNPLEGYIMKHSEAKFTHGICPECAKKYFPDSKQT